MDLFLSFHFEILFRSCRREWSVTDAYFAGRVWVRSRSHWFFNSCFSEARTLKSSGEKGRSVLFPFASYNPNWNTHPNRSFCGTCVLDRMHRVGQLFFARCVLGFVRVGWYHFTISLLSMIPSRSHIGVGATFCYIKWVLVGRVDISWVSARFMWVGFNLDYKLCCQIGSSNDIVLCSLFHHVDVFSSKDWKNTVVGSSPICKHKDPMRFFHNLTLLKHMAKS